jgi:hypothetical protein
MESLSLQDIIAAHTKMLVDHLEEFLPLIHLLLLLGEGPVSPEQVAARMHGTTQQVEEILQTWSLVVDADGAMQMVAGAGCALDRLLFPLLTGKSPHVVATCKASAEKIRLTVSKDGIQDLEPTSAVLFLRLPGETTNAEHVPATICPYGHFFVDREHAAAWPGLHPEAVLLSLEDATDLARAIAEATRSSAEQELI